MRREIIAVFAILIFLAAATHPLVFGEDSTVAENEAETVESSAVDSEPVNNVVTDTGSDEQLIEEDVTFDIQPLNDSIESGNSNEAESNISTSEVEGRVQIQNELNEANELNDNELQISISNSTLPSTSSSFSSSDWQNVDISITLACTDCDTTYYCIDAGDNCDLFAGSVYSSTILHATEGIYYIRYASQNAAGNESVKSQILKLDKTKPSIAISSPIEGQQISGSSYIINGTSADNISGIAKIEILINNLQAATGKESWQYEWKDFSDGSHKITATATDNAGKAANVSVNVIVDNPPSARITSLGSPPLVKAGRIEVTLQTSEPVQFSPTLSYSLGSGNIQIPLDGSSQTWTGFMIISEADHNKIGTFSFSAKDFNGNVGNVITQGSFFVVDAVKPEKVASINAEIEDDKVKLTWFYEGETLKQFNIYRDEQSNVDYADLYKNVDSAEQDFEEDIGSKTYYYRIAAVDLAGNVGPLSDEVFVTAEGSSSSSSSQQPTTTISGQAITTQTLPNEVLRKIDSAVERINSQLSEIDKAKVVLERNSYSAEIGLILQLNEAKAKFNGFKEELERLRSSTDANNVEEEIQKIDLRAKSLLNALPKDISVISEDSFIQETSLKDIEDIAALTYNLEDDRELYILQNQRLQNKVEVKVSATVFKVIYFEGEGEITLIKKDIETQQSNTSVIEVIPKIIASSVNEINFLTQDYEVLEEDPIVRWNEEQKIIGYYVNKKVSQNELRDAKTLVLSDLKEGTSPITGFVTGLIVQATSNTKLIIGLLVLSLLIVFYFVYLRNGETEETEIEDYSRKDNRHKHELAPSTISYQRYQYPPHSYQSESKVRDSIGRSESEIRFDKYAQSLSGQQRRQVQSLALIPKNDFLEHFYELTEKANYYADDGNFKLAGSSYSLLVELYNKLGRNEKRDAYREILKIYNKLNLYAKIREIYTAEKANPNMNLHHLLEHVAEIYAEVAVEGRDTRLLSLAREYYTYMLSKFKRF